jgi:NAD(P)-dependent dehydrogenase (short-subunit alcohol dehydrogenase family)
VFDLAGKVALVTGAGQGNAVKLLEVLTECGAEVVVNDVEVDRAEEVAKRFGARAAPFDVTDLEAVRAGGADLGPVDILVNNAGLPPGAARAPFLEQTPEQWRPYIDVNLFGVLNCVHVFLPGMLERQWGRIITITSGAALIGSNIGMSIYAAGKAGALGFTRALAWEVAQSGVTVNAISLGMMENAAGGVSPTYRRVVQPMERWGTGRDIGAAVVWLAAEAGWVTGQTIAVDGGVVMIR